MIDKVWVVAEASALCGNDEDGEDLAVETISTKAKVCKDKKSAMKALRELVGERVRACMGPLADGQFESKTSQVLGGMGKIGTRKDPLFVVYWFTGALVVEWKVFKTKVEGIR